MDQNWKDVPQEKNSYFDYSFLKFPIFFFSFLELFMNERALLWMYGIGKEAWGLTTGHAIRAHSQIT